MGTTLTTFQVVVVILSAVLGATNVFVQTGKIFNTWPVPQKVLPFLVVFGSFLGGFYSSLKDHSTIDKATLFYAFFSGFNALLFGVAPSAAAHVFGWQVHKSRPAPVTSTTPTIPAPPPANNVS